MICLDSTFLIDLFNGNPDAVSKFKEIAATEQSVTTIINAAELLLGFYGVKNPREEVVGSAIRLLRSMPVFQLKLRGIIKAGEILNSQLKEGRPSNEKDILIAGIMLTNGCSTILTKDTKDFERISGIRVLTY